MSTKTGKSRDMGREREKNSKNEDAMRADRKTMKEDRDVKGQQSGRNQFPLGVAGSGHWSANATL